MPLALRAFNFLHFNGAVCSNTLLLDTSALTNSLLFRASSTHKILEHLVWSNTSGSQFWGPLARTNFLSALCGPPRGALLIRMNLRLPYQFCPRTFVLSVSTLSKSRHVLKIVQNQHKMTLLLQEGRTVKLMDKHFVDIWASLRGKGVMLKENKHELPTFLAKGL